VGGFDIGAAIINRLTIRQGDLRIVCGSLRFLTLAGRTSVLGDFGQMCRWAAARYVGGQDGLLTPETMETWQSKEQE